MTDKGRESSHQPLFGGRWFFTSSFNRLARGFYHLAVSEHQLQASNMLPRRTIFEPMASAGIDRNHTAEGGHTTHCWIGTELSTKRVQVLVHVGVNGSW